MAEPADDTVIGRRAMAVRPRRGQPLLVAVGGFAWAAPVMGLALLLGPDTVFVPIATFFSKMAVVTFGGAYAVLAYVAQQAVEAYGWLKPGEMVDGLALAETTPGPLVLVLTFVGYLAAFRAPGPLDPVAAGLIGGALTTWVTFVPCFLWIFLGAPYVERLRGNAAIAGALSAITAAVVGIILNLAIWFALHVLFRETTEFAVGPLRPKLPVVASLDLVSLGLAAGSALLLFRAKLGVAWVLALAALAGLAIRTAGLAP